MSVCGTIVCDNASSVSVMQVCPYNRCACNLHYWTLATTFSGGGQSYATTTAAAAAAAAAAVVVMAIVHCYLFYDYRVLVFLHKVNAQ